MQYILSDIEYGALKLKIKNIERREKDKIQKLCTMVASFKPVSFLSAGEDATPKPWGCIKNEENNPSYCDNCPVTSDCPYDQKKWSSN